jgi:hypothetical protein
VAEYLPDVCKALGLISSTANKKNEKKSKRRRKRRKTRNKGGGGRGILAWMWTNSIPQTLLVRM